jgi:hypothetical protein
MPQFTKTVSQLSRAQLLSAATAFQLDNTGSVTALRARVKAHIDSHEDLMGDPDYRPLFSPTQRRRYPAYPAPWGCIDATPCTPGDQSDEDDDADDDDLDEADETPPGTVNQPSSDLQALKSLVLWRPNRESSLQIFGVTPDVIQSTPEFGGGFYPL